jgi:hypothetical protein
MPVRCPSKQLPVCSHYREQQPDVEYTNWPGGGTETVFRHPAYAQIGESSVPGVDVLYLIEFIVQNPSRSFVLQMTPVTLPASAKSVRARPPGNNGAPAPLLASRAIAATDGPTSTGAFHEHQLQSQDPAQRRQRRRHL